MRLTLEIAKRYLLGKKSSNAINLITWISITGIAIGTAALLLILTVFNGFKSLLSDMFDAFNPDLKITLVEGKVFDLDSLQADDILKIDGVIGLSKTIEELAMFEYDNTQKIGVIKGVDKAFSRVTDIDTTLISGSFVTRQGNINYGVIGMGLSNMLGVNHRDAITPITVYMPFRKSKGPLAKEFKIKELYPSGIFSVKGESDMKYVISSYGFVNRLLDYDDKLSAIELRLDPDANESKVRADLLALIGDGYKIANKYQQNETFLKIMNIEKWVSYLIACLTLLLIAFNLVGSLWMIVLDKKKDISILRSMGLESKDIERIFKEVGLLITGIGLALGMILAISIYLLQKNVGIIHIPDGMMTTAYPVDINFMDFIVVPLTVILIGYGASILPSRVAGRMSTSLR